MSLKPEDYLLQQGSVVSFYYRFFLFASHTRFKTKFCILYWYIVRSYWYYMQLGLLPFGLSNEFKTPYRLAVVLAAEALRELIRIVC